MDKKTYTTNEAAAELGVSSARVRQMVIDKTLPATRFGRALVISADALNAARHRKTSPGPAARTPGKPSAANQAATQPANGSNKVLTAAAKAKKKGKR
jgi:excisionase family DNA binding protein